MLRAPDPTLALLPDDDLLAFESHERTDSGWRPMQVLVVHSSESGHYDPNLRRAPAMHLRYSGAACRDCFPDAPPPGHGSGLEWQVQP